MQDETAEVKAALIAQLQAQGRAFQSLQHDAAVAFWDDIHEEVDGMPVSVSPKIGGLVFPVWDLNAYDAHLPYGPMNIPDYSLDDDSDE